MWEIDRETVAKILSFVSKGLREIDLEKAREGQKRLAHSVTTSASKQMDMTKVTAASGEEDIDDEKNDLQEHTKIDLRLSLDLCDVRLLRFDSNELCKMSISNSSSIYRAICSYLYVITNNS